MTGGGQSSSQPSTTTQITDIPEWERGYVTDLLGQAQAISKQPYQQFPGPQVAGFTPDQLAAFQGIENIGNQIDPLQEAATGAATQGTQSANSIYGTGSPYVQGATGYNPLQAVAPYLAQTSNYNSAAAGQPWLGQAAGYQAMAANAATPQGIQNYMSPYTNSVVQGIQDEANQNWSQKIMPSINDSFIGSGNFGSGRNAQVLAQNAGNFQTGLSANVANALQSGYGMAGNQAAAQAGILGNLGSQSLTGAGTAGGLQQQQVGNLLNAAQGAGTATNQQAQNLLSAGSTLGNLAATQSGAQLAGGTLFGNLSQQQQAQDLAQQQALQAVGQQQQQLNQTNLDVAQQNFQNQVNWPKSQTEYLNQIIRGLPTPSVTTGSSQTTPAYSVSPLSGIGGAGVGALSLLGSNGSPLGTAVSHKKGGLIKKYADGGEVDDEANDSEYDNDIDDTDIGNAVDDTIAPTSVGDYSRQIIEAQQQAQQPQSPLAAPQEAPQQEVPQVKPQSSPLVAAGNSPQNDGLSSTAMQQNQLLALARGLLTPSLGGSVSAAVGQGIGNMQDYTLKQQQLMSRQAQVQQQRELEQKRIGIEQQRADSYKDLVQARKSGAGGVTQSIIDKLMKENPDLSYEEALALAKRAPNSDQSELRRETLALNAYKNGVPIKDNPTPTIEDYRKMYGVGQTHAKGKNTTAAAAPKESASANIPDGAIAYLKAHPDMASKFELKYGTGSAAQYLGQ